MFQRKTDACCISILYDTSDLPDKFQFHGIGYHYPLDTNSQSPPRPDGFPSIFTYPEVSIRGNSLHEYCREIVKKLWVFLKDKIDKHWLMVVKVFTEHERELSTMEKVVCFCDEVKYFFCFPDLACSL